MTLNRRITDWRNQRVWIIGASSGIGAALATLLLQQGARVAVSARNAQQLQARFSGFAGALPLTVDVTQPQSLDDAMRVVVSRWGGLDCLMVLAGDYYPIRAWDLQPGRAQRMIATNLTGAIDAVATALPQLLAQQRGAIVLVSSVAGYRGLPNSLLYGATKAALINFAETLYLDLSMRGVDVYLVNPGFVATALTAQNTFRMPALISAEAAAAATLAGLAQGRFEVHYPKRFTRWLKLLRLVPYRLYFALIRRFVTGAM